MFAQGQRLFAQPDDIGPEPVGGLGQIGGRRQHIAATDVDLILQGERDGHGRVGLGQLAVIGDDGLDRAAPARGQRGDPVARAHDAAGQGAAIAAKVRIGAIDVLHRQAHIGQISVGGDLDAVEDRHERRARIPAERRAPLDHIVALQGRDRDETRIGPIQPGREIQIIGLDPIEDPLLIADQVHLVDRHDDMPDAKQGGDHAVPPGLCLHPVAGVDQDDGQIRGRGPGGHVAGVLFVAGRVGDDEFTRGGGEVAVGDVDGDALLAFGLQAVHQQRQIHLGPGRAGFDAVPAQLGQLILIDHPGIMQQAANQGAFAVINAAAG